MKGRPGLLINQALTQKLSDERLRDLNMQENATARAISAVTPTALADVSVHTERAAIYNELLSTRTALRIREEADKRVFKAVFSTATRARTVFIRTTSMLEAMKIAQVVEDVYRKARPGALAIEHLIMTNDVQTPTPELTLEEAILWALSQE